MLCRQSAGILSRESRRLAAIMFADIVGYTALGQKNESLSLAVIEENRKLLRPIFARHNGREVKAMGDSFLVEFSNALDSIRCAYDIQRASREFNIAIPTDRRIRLRVGVHLGDVIQADGDIMGDAVNVASRIEPLAQEGGICITRQVYDQVSNKFELPLVSLGKKALKNVREPVEVYAVEMPWEKGEGRVSEATRLDKRRVAVLPFANISPDPKDEYFADGMTEEVIASVSRMEGLNVISRTSAMQYKNSPKKMGEIARELGVGTLVEGSVRKAGDRVRITVQLIDPVKDEHKWVQSWERNIEDIFAIQSEIAKRIASSLKVRLIGPGRLKTRASKKEAAEAYDLYLKAWHMMQDAVEVVDQRALGYLQAALGLDPTSALAHNGLAWYYLTNMELLIPGDEAWPKVKEFAEKALSLDSELSEAHISLAMAAAQNEWDWALAEREYREAIRLNPNSSEALQHYGFFLMCPLGLFEEAEQYLRKAEELDPWNMGAKGSTAWVLFLTHRYAEAEAKIKEMRETSRADWLGAMLLARIYLETSRPQKALDEARKLEEHSGYSFRLGHVGCLYGALGNKDEANRILQKLLNPPKGLPLTFALGLTHLGLGNRKEAIMLFNQACDEHSPALVNAYQLPELQRLKSEPGFDRIEDKVGTKPFLATRTQSQSDSLSKGLKLDKHSSMSQKRNRT
jgi:adenylate cyclase